MRQAIRKMTAVTILFIALAFAAIVILLHAGAEIVDWMLSKLGAEDNESDWWG